MALNGPETLRMAQALCPFLKRKCVAEKCALWMRHEQTDGASTRVVEACAFVLQTLLNAQGVMESIRAQASTDKVATQVNQGFTGLLALAGRRARAIDSTHVEEISGG